MGLGLVSPGPVRKLSAGLAGGLGEGTEKTGKGSDQLVFRGARGSATEEQSPRELEPWEKQIQAIDELAVPDEEKVRRLLDFARTLSQEEQAFVYSSACSLASSSSTYQQSLCPLVWNPHTPGPVARAVAAGVVTEPDRFKFPALLALQRHPHDETRAMALSVLWAYFPDEPVANYPLAVQRFLAGAY